MNKIEIGKKYKTRHGLRVRILCTDAMNLEDESKLPVVALVSTGNEDILLKYSEFGIQIDRINDYDLIEVKQYDHIKHDEPSTIHDEFAMSALNGFIGKSCFGQLGEDFDLMVNDKEEHFRQMANLAYMSADAMMRAREESKPKASGEQLEEVQKKHTHD